MKETQFIQQRQSEWSAWDRWLKKKPSKSAREAAKDGAAEGASAQTEITAEVMPSSFRRLCQDVSLARDRNYSAPLVQTLHSRMLVARQRIYGARQQLSRHWLEFLVAGLPRLIRLERRVVLAAAVLFFLPLLISQFVIQVYPEGIYMLMPPAHVAQYEEMYSPTAAHLGRPREASDELSMLVFYIANNVRIDFQCFASGITFGIGSIFFLVYNGLMIGSVAGYLTQHGYIETFWGFVAGHSAPELIGAVLSGAAGLKIGLALAAPGRRRRIDALTEAGHGA